MQVVDPIIHPKAIEAGGYAEMYDGKWRIHNGAEWVHSFERESEAIEKCIKWNGIATGRAVYNAATGFNEYVEVKRWV